MACGNSPRSSYSTSICSSSFGLISCSGHKPSCSCLAPFAAGIPLPAWASSAQHGPGETDTPPRSTRRLDGCASPTVATTAVAPPSRPAPRTWPPASSTQWAYIRQVGLSRNAPASWHIVSRRRLKRPRMSCRRSPS
eukprot:scaffold80848_cov30-Tisochrysis_lutea.AAC.2